MVVYFSATGNTEFIARELATRPNDECVNLLDRIKAGDNTPPAFRKAFRDLCAHLRVRDASLYDQVFEKTGL